MIVFLSIRRFYVSRHLERRPLAVSKDGFLLDCDEEALRSGLCPGMPAQHAKAIIGSAQILEWKSSSYVESQKRWLSVCVQFSDCIEPVVQHATYVDLSQHPEPEKALLELISAIKSEMQLEVNAAASDIKWIAKLSSDRGGHCLSLGSLPVSDLLPVKPESRLRLEFLGYKTIGEVSRLPISVLRKQFGDEAIVIQQAANGVGPKEKVNPLYPPRTVFKTFHFEGTANDRESLNNGIQAVSKSISDRLRDCDRYGKSLTVLIELEDGQKLSAKRTHTKPLQSANSIAFAVHLALARMTFEVGVVSIRIRMDNLQTGAETQRNLNFAQTSDRTSLLQSISKDLRSSFGDSSVLLAAESRTPRRKRLLQEWKNVTGWS